ncbi:hypothetical protein V8C26DRAFT_294646 [Trichoderma gracile]
MADSMCQDDAPSYLLKKRRPRIDEVSRAKAPCPKLGSRPASPFGIKLQIEGRTWKPNRHGTYLTDVCAEIQSISRAPNLLLNRLFTCYAISTARSASRFVKRLSDTHTHTHTHAHTCYTPLSCRVQLNLCVFVLFFPSSCTPLRLNTPLSPFVHSSISIVRPYLSVRVHVIKIAQYEDIPTQLVTLPFSTRHTMGNGQISGGFVYAKK